MLVSCTSDLGRHVGAKNIQAMCMPRILCSRLVLSYTRAIAGAKNMRLRINELIVLRSLDGISSMYSRRYTLYHYMFDLASSLSILLYA